MTIDPAELSALLDGELPPVRAAEVQAAIDADPHLAAAFHALGGDDLAWRRAAQTAAFQPAPVPAAIPVLETTACAAALLAVLVILRAISDMPEAWLWFALPQAAALALATLWLTSVAHANHYAQR
jgi:anti-sigma factor RsiW